MQGKKSSHWLQKLRTALLTREIASLESLSWLFRNGYFISNFQKQKGRMQGFFFFLGDSTNEVEAAER